MEECSSLWRELLHIPDNYHILFLAAAASSAVPLCCNELFDHKAALPGDRRLGKEISCRGKGLAKSRGLGDNAAYAIASSADKTYSYIPKGYTIPSDLDYFHITTNNTIYGTEIKTDMDCPVPLVADMSSIS